MLRLAQTMQDPETKAQMERLAADWLWMAEQAEESRSKRDDAAVLHPRLEVLVRRAERRTECGGAQPCPATAR
jgi:hypothetical protein